MTTVTSRDQIYDLDQYAFMAATKGQGWCGPFTVIWLLKTRGADRISLELSCYNAVNAYLIDHPEKRVDFDGCCEHWPVC